MATLGALRHPWHPLLPPYRTHVLCPLDLCQNLCLKAEVAGLLSPQVSVAGSARGAIPVNTTSLRLPLAPDLCPNLGGRHRRSFGRRLPVQGQTLRLECFFLGEKSESRGVLASLSARNLTEFLTEFFYRDSPSETIRRVISQPFLDTWSWTERAGVSLCIDLRHTMLILLVLFVASAWEVS